MYNCHVSTFPLAELIDIFQAIEMVEDVRSAFAEAVEELDWMDSTTRVKTLSKLSAIRNFVGFPAWLLTAEQLDKHYKHVSLLGIHINRIKPISLDYK